MDCTFFWSPLKLSLIQADVNSVLVIADERVVNSFSTNSDFKAFPICDGALLRFVNVCHTYVLVSCHAGVLHFVTCIGEQITLLCSCAAQCLTSLGLVGCYIILQPWSTFIAACAGICIFVGCCC